MKTYTKALLLIAAGGALATLPSVLAGAAGDKFKEMDANGDGRATHEEYTSNVQARFAKIDANGDGSIAAAEWTAAREKPKKNPLKFWEKDEPEPAGPALSPTGKLGPADANSDGQITRAEYEAEAETMFTTLDADHDGALTEQELAAADQAAQPAK